MIIFLLRIFLDERRLNLFGFIGYAMMRGMTGFRNGNGSMGDCTNRIKGQISFSSRQNSPAGLMSQISEIGSEVMVGRSPEESNMGIGNGSGRCYIPGFPVASWDDSPLLADNYSGLKRAREAEGKIIAGLDPSNPQVFPLDHQTL